MNAAILSIGTELTRGEVHNSNATWLSDAISSMGMTVQAIHTVPDDGASIRRALSGFANESSLIVCTGGLGPTSDDITAREVALLLGLPLVRDEASYSAIVARLQAAGRPLSPSNEKQADLPAGCQVLLNECGTAPGFALDIGSARAFFLPGVPREMRTMFERYIRAEVERRRTTVARQARLKVYGLPEAEVNERLSGLEERFEVTLGYRARFPEIEVKVLLTEPPGVDLQRKLRAAVDEVQRRLGDAAYTLGDATFAETVAQLLRSRGLSLGLAESCTGGLLSQMLTARPASDYFRGAIVCYDNQVKRQLLGVPEAILTAHGAVSEATIRAMAEGARRVLDCDLGLAISGIAGPSGGSREKPVGLVYFGLATSDRTIIDQRVFAGDREQVQVRAAYHALDLLRGLTRELHHAASPA